MSHLKREGLTRHRQETWLHRHLRMQPKTERERVKETLTSLWKPRHKRQTGHGFGCRTDLDLQGRTSYVLSLSCAEHPYLHIKNRTQTSSVSGACCSRITEAINVSHDAAPTLVYRTNVELKVPQLETCRKGVATAVALPRGSTPDEQVGGVIVGR